MVNASLRTNDGKLTTLQRGYTPNGSLSSTQYLPPTKIRLGINQVVATTSTSSLTQPIPVEYGTPLDNGDNTLTGSSGGTNSTDNTTTYKEGAGELDVTAQNLIANGSNDTKIWTISDLSTLGTVATATSRTSIWLYIIDATALAKFLSSGTCLEIKLGSDVSNYYSKTFELTDLAVGWNFLALGQLDANTETGTVSGPINYFVIEVTTNNASDEFVAGDLVYDLLRQWVDADEIVHFTSGYPTFDNTNREVTIRTLINSAKANGFDINALCLINEDTSELLTDLHVFTSESKSSSDQFAFVITNRNP